MLDAFLNRSCWIPHGQRRHACGWSRRIHRYWCWTKARGIRRVAPRSGCRFGLAAVRRSSASRFQFAVVNTGTRALNLHSNRMGVTSILGDTSMNLEKSYFQRNFSAIDRVAKGTKRRWVCQEVKTLVEIWILTREGYPWPYRASFPALGHSTTTSVSAARSQPRRGWQRQSMRKFPPAALSHPRLLIWQGLTQIAKPWGLNNAHRRPGGGVWSRVPVARVRQDFRVLRLESLSSFAGKPERTAGCSAAIGSRGDEIWQKICSDSFCC